MKIVVMTDSHGRLDYMIKVIEKERPEIVLFAGDYSNDCIELKYIKEEIEYYIVKGNTDLNDYNTPEIVEMNIEDKKIFLTHGHLFGVKRGYEIIKEEGLRRESSIVVFGHTHIPYIEKWKDITFFNPGAMKDGKYGGIVFETDKFRIEQKSIF